MLIEILFKILLFKGGVLIYAEHCMYIYIYIYIYNPEHVNSCIAMNILIKYSLHDTPVRDCTCLRVVLPFCAHPPLFSALNLASLL